MGKTKNASSLLQSSSSPLSAASKKLIVVLPGDNVTQYMIPSLTDTTSTIESSKPISSKVILGTGLRYDTSTQQVYATLAGRLQCNNNNSVLPPASSASSSAALRKPVYFVLQNTKRYRPHVEDRVIGIVQDRIGADGAGGELFRVEMGASHLAVLSNLSFEGATKRNKPQLGSGQLYYCRVSTVYNNGAGVLDPVLSCELGPADKGLPQKDWMTNEGCYGELKGGTCCRISTGLARELLLPNNLVLEQLALPRNGRKLPFEVAIGVNGYLWIHSPLPEYTIMIQNAILNSQVMTEEQVRAMVKSLFYTVEKKLQQDRDSAEGY